MKAGFSKKNITPVHGLVIPGYFEERKGNGVLTDLYSKAVVFDNGETVVAIAAIDSLGGTFAITEKVRESASARTGIPKENILVHSTHAHTAGPTDAELYACKPDNGYTEFLCSMTADAIVEAFNNRREAVIGSYKTTEETISFNRRFYMKNGAVKMNPGIMNPDIVKSEGTKDTDVTVLRVDDAETGKAMGVITNFACHLDCVGGTKYCGDYPSVMAEIIANELGRDVISVFLNGCCGDINHIDFIHPCTIRAEHWKKMGRILAYDVLSAREKALPDKINDLEAKYKYITIERRPVTSEELAWAEKNKESTSKMERTFAEDILALSKKERKPYFLPMQCIKIGDTAIVSVPGEVFTDIGLGIKKASGFKNTMVVELGNANIGYVASTTAHENRLKQKDFELTTLAYETRLSQYVDAVPETAELFVKTGAELLG